VVTGISPTIAQTIVHMGVRLDGVTTRRSLRDALQDFVRGRIDVRDEHVRDADTHGNAKNQRGS
jgi:hypothetical protein